MTLPDSVSAVHYLHTCHRRRLEREGIGYSIYRMYSRGYTRDRESDGFLFFFLFFSPLGWIWNTWQAAHVSIQDVCISEDVFSFVHLSDMMQDFKKKEAYTATEGYNLGARGLF